jgi:hypothetical protein
VLMSPNQAKQLESDVHRQVQSSIAFNHAAGDLHIAV